MKKIVVTESQLKKIIEQTSEFDDTPQVEGSPELKAFFEKKYGDPLTHFYNSDPAQFKYDDMIEFATEWANFLTHNNQV